MRPAVAAVDRELTRVAGGTRERGADLGELLRSWAELIEVLALGPAPEMRECPTCRHRGMRAATRCGFCWAALPPLARGAPSVRAGTRR